MDDAYYTEVAKKKEEPETTSTFRAVTSTWRSLHKLVDGKVTSVDTRPNAFHLL